MPNWPTAALCALSLSAVAVSTVAGQHGNNPLPYRTGVPGACRWSTTATVGVSLGYPQLRGMDTHFASIGRAPAHWWHVTPELRHHKVPYVVANYGTHDYKTIYASVNRGVPAIVGVHVYDQAGKIVGAHAVAIVGRTGDTLRVYDPNEPHKIGTMTRQSFERSSMGDHTIITPCCPPGAVGVPVRVYPVR